MPLQVVSPRIRGFICASAHPGGCAANVAEQAAVAEGAGLTSLRGRTALIVGGTTGYGLASRVCAGIGCGMRTIGIGLERGPSGGRTASAGWYNTAAFHAEAARVGADTVSLNGDAFSHGARSCVIEELRRRDAQIDLLIYSLASPVRVDPDTGVTVRSTLKPIGQAYTTRTLDLNRYEVSDVTVEPATEEEIAGTVTVMGGLDFQLWIESLLDAGLLAPGARALAFSYIGPQVTWAIYRSGTIGRAKEDLESRTQTLDGRLSEAVRGHAWVSVNKAVVTQASSAIPAVPLYLSLLYPVMQAAGTHERPIEQMVRLFRDHLGPAGPTLDAESRIRLDDWEMEPSIQEEVARRWTSVTAANLGELADVDGYQREFRRLFGFDVPGVDAGAPVETDVPIPGLIEVPPAA